MSHYNIFRDDLQLGTLAATNTPETTTYEFHDPEIEDGETYSYSLEAMELDGTSYNYGPYILTIDIGEEQDPPDLPELTGLFGNYPNPFNPSTKIFFEVQDGETATLSIFNVRGQIIEQNQFPAGNHEYLWLSKKMESGLYFYKLDSPSYSRTKKMVILK